MLSAVRTVIGLKFFDFSNDLQLITYLTADDLVTYDLLFILYP